MAQHWNKTGWIPKIICPSCGIGLEEWERCRVGQSGVSESVCKPCADVLSERIASRMHTPPIKCYAVLDVANKATLERDGNRSRN